MKEYTKPILNEEKVEIEDIIAQSGAGTGSFGGGAAGDKDGQWPFN